MLTAGQLGRGVLAAAICCACSGGSDDDQGDTASPFVVVTFNTGIPQYQSGAVYGADEAAIASDWYGTGLSFNELIADTRAFFDQVQPDIVAFQEIFHPGECASIPAEYHPGFVCEGWQPGDPTVAQRVLGDGYQVACHLEKPDKCLAVKKSFGRFDGCDADLCLDHLDGARIDGCGGGSRIGRGRLTLADGQHLAVVNVHGSSGLAQADQDCRVLQFAQVFEDIGDGSGEPAANGEQNVVLGDLNTDPGRNADFDESAAKWLEFVGDGKRFHFITEVGPNVAPTYGGFFNIDHVASDAHDGSCWTAGYSEGHPAVTDIVAFDHRPAVCTLK